MQKVDRARSEGCSFIPRNFFSPFKRRDRQTFERENSGGGIRSEQRRCRFGLRETKFPAENSQLQRIHHFYIAESGEPYRQVCASHELRRRSGVGIQGI